MLHLMLQARSWQVRAFPGLLISKSSLVGPCQHCLWCIQLLQTWTGVQSCSLHRYKQLSLWPSTCCQRFFRSQLWAAAGQASAPAGSLLPGNAIQDGRPGKLLLSCMAQDQ